MVNEWDKGLVVRETLIFALSIITGKRSGRGNLVGVKLTGRLIKNIAEINKEVFNMLNELTCILNFRKKKVTQPV